MTNASFAALENAVQKDYPNIAAIAVQKNGETLYNGLFGGCQEGQAMHVYSVTKSVFSMLMGIALEEGLISSLDQPVLDFFPDYKVLPGESTIQKVSIKHLLTMTAPYKYDTEPYELFFTSPDPITAALDLLGGDKPIGEFNYSGVGGTHILSGIFQRATGKNALEFAQERIFKHMGIDVPRSLQFADGQEFYTVMNSPDTKGWASDPMGFTTASWGLFLTPQDMLKLGGLYLDGGRWNGVQLVPERWVNASTQEHSRWGDMRYGYLWWLIDENCFAALGDGGCAIYVDKKNKLVVAIAGRMLPDVKVGDSVELIKKYIEPAL